MNKKVLMVFAHPDDEVICGWPILQNKEYDKELIICSSDLYNKSRAWCSHRRYVLESLCDHLKIPFYCFDYSSEFYLSPARRGSSQPRQIFFPFRFNSNASAIPPLLSEICESILKKIREKKYDYIFTHNFWGEYGHIDHILINALIFNNFSSPILVSDARIPLNWLPLLTPAQSTTALLQGRIHSRHILDKSFYDFCQKHYEEKKVWTWSMPAIEMMNLYLFDNR